MNKNDIITIIHKSPIWTGKVLSGSMAPLLEPGDRVEFVRVSANELKIHDIVAYKRKTAICIHRIVRIIHTRRGRIFITKGDGQPWFDPPVSSQKIIARATRVRYAFTSVSLTGWQNNVLYYVLTRTLLKHFVRKVLRSQKVAVWKKNLLL